MADNHSPQVRSYNMSRIRSTNTKPEDIVRKYLFSKGFRYRKNDRRYLGKPDIILPKYRTIIFIHGCFWHKHEGCQYFVWPKSNTAYWEGKINRNVERDQATCDSLRKQGWRIITVWECELKPSKREDTLCRLEENIKYKSEESST